MKLACFFYVNFNLNEQKLVTFVSDEMDVWLSVYQKSENYYQMCGTKATFGVLYRNIKAIDMLSVNFPKMLFAF